MNGLITNLQQKPLKGNDGLRTYILNYDVALSFSSGAIFPETKSFLLDVRGGDGIMTIDGSFPSVTNGHRLIDGKAYTISKAVGDAAKFTRVNEVGSVYMIVSQLTL